MEPSPKLPPLLFDSRSPPPNITRLHWSKTQRKAFFCGDSPPRPTPPHTTDGARGDLCTTMA